MRLKKHILAAASTAALRQIAEDFELDVADKRQRQMLFDAISSARRCQPEDLLNYLSEQEVKQVCDVAGVESRGRKNSLIERLLEAATPASPRPSAPKRASNTNTLTFSHPPKRTSMSDLQPSQADLQLPKSDSDKTSVEKYEFEPIKGYPMLNWRGKRPFTSTHYYPAQLKEVHGEEVDGWRNKIFWGDNNQVLSHLLKSFRKSIDLIYIDPPFDSGADYKKKVALKGKEITNSSSTFEEKQYGDLWVNDEYLQFMFERLILARELLADGGSIFVHCDRHRNHLLRCLLDEVFGRDVEEKKPGLQNEIIWFYPDSPGRPENRFAPKHDTIYWYSRTSEYVFNADSVREPILEASKKRYESSRYLINSQGKRFEYTGGASSDDGKIPETVWRIPVVKGNAREATSYPTQKPEALLERIILAASRPGDIVFDFFMGSGTAQAVAMKLGRRFIGADINLGAIQTTTKRLINAADGLRQKPLAADAKYYTGFEVYNVNHYDVFRNPVQAKELLIEALEIQGLEMSSVFDGEKDGRMVKIMPVNRIATRADLNELIAGFDYKAWERRQSESPTRAVEKITLVCMGHEPDLKAQLELAAKPFKIDVQVFDILRDKADLEFKRDSEAKVVLKKRELIVDRFFPMNLLQKLSLQKEAVEDWRELVESILIDWNYDGAVLQPSVVDIPGKNDLVEGRYPVPADAGTIRVKITDLLSESWEGCIAND